MHLQLTFKRDFPSEMYRTTQPALKHQAGKGPWIMFFHTSDEDLRTLCMRTGAVRNGYTV